MWWHTTWHLMLLVTTHVTIMTRVIVLLLWCNSCIQCIIVTQFLNFIRALFRYQNNYHYHFASFNFQSRPTPVTNFYFKTQSATLAATGLNKSMNMTLDWPELWHRHTVLSRVSATSAIFYWTGSRDTTLGVEPPVSTVSRSPLPPLPPNCTTLQSYQQPCCHNFSLIFTYRLHFNFYARMLYGIFWQ